MSPTILFLRRKLKDFPVSVQYLYGTKRRSPGTMIAICMKDGGRISPELYQRVRDVIPGNRCYTWGAKEIQVHRDVVSEVIECQQTTARV